VTAQDQRLGWLYGIAAFGLWGLFPLYFKTFQGVPRLEILAHRILWCLLCLTIVVLVLGRGRTVVQCLRPGRLRWLLLSSTLLIATNWLLFLYGVESNQVVQTSLGYFMTPLFNVALGVLVFGERLRLANQFGLAIAAVGLVYAMVNLGQIPWIAVGLALTFSLYGLVRKLAVVDGLVGLMIETLLLAPAASLFLGWSWYWETLAFGNDHRRDLFIALSGLVTAIPLLCFAQAARRLPLASLGLLQYLAPTGQLLIALFLLSEPFPKALQVGFYCTWVGLALISLDALQLARSRAAARRLALAAPAEGVEISP
jgi:chloramphenicol-sensitive protein RarD